MAVLVTAVAALSLGSYYEVQWLQTASVILMVAGAGISVGVIKKISAKEKRSDGPDSVESALDLQARAQAFNDGLVVLASAILIAVIRPETPAWVIAPLSFAALVVAYWVRQGLARRSKLQ